MSSAKHGWGIALAILAAIVVGNTISKLKSSSLNSSFDSDRPKKSMVAASPKSTPAPPATPLPSPRSLANGEILVQPEGGNGKLTVENGTDRDALVKLIDPESKQMIASFYIQKSQDSDLENIPDGSYEILFALGLDWEPKTSRFTRNAQYSKFEQRADFITNIRAERYSQITETSRYRVMLNPSPVGNARTQEISDRDFEKYK